MPYSVQNITVPLSVLCRAGCVFFGLLFSFAFGLKVNGQTATTTTLTSNPNPSCLNQSVTFTATVSSPLATGTVTFWDNITVIGSAALSGGTASISISSLSAGAHNNIFAVYNGVAPYNGSQSLPITHTINSPPGISSQPASQTAGIGCTASFSVTAVSTLPFTYQWRKNGVNIDGATSDNYTIANVAAVDGGNYDVAITNGCGTVISNVALLTVNSPLTVTLTSQTNVLCFGGSTGAINITASGGTGTLTYDWADVAGASNSEDRTNLPAGTYGVTVADANGCTTAQLSVTITQPASAVTVAVTSQTNVLCFGASTGAINITASGGTGVLTYDWADVAGTSNSQDRTNLPAGTYSVTVTDASGCTTAPLSVTITQPASAVTVAVTSQTNVLCFGASTGAVNITASGGTGTLTYDWADVAGTTNSEDRTNLPPGAYSITVTDANGCTASLNNIV